MKKPLQVLLVEDSEDDARLVVRELDLGGYDVTVERVETPEAMRAALKRGRWDLVICDYQLPHFSGPAAIKLLQDTGLDLPVIVVSGTIGEDVAVAMMKAGAHDYLMKGRLARLVPAVERELREAEERSERRRMEAELLASEVRYRRLFESAKDGILILNADTGTVVDVNPYLIEALGVPREQFVGKKAWEIGGLQAIMPDQAGFTALRRQANARFEDKPLVATDGRRIVVEFVSTVYPVDHHTVMQCNFRDITERRQAEQTARQSQEQLREEEARFRALVEKAYESVSVLDGEGRIKYASPSSERILGYRAEALTGRSAFDLLHPDDLARAKAALTSLIGTPGEALHVELRGMQRAGQVRWLEVTGTNLLHIPSVHGVVLNYRDITERKEAEETLHRSEEQFRQIVETSPSGICTVNERGEITLVNSRMEELFGYPAAELLGQPVEMLVPDRSRSAHQALRAQALLQSKSRRMGESAAYPARRKDGTEFQVEISLHPITMPEGRRMLAIIADITDRVRAEEMLRQSEAGLKEAQRIAHVGSWQLDLATNHVVWTEELYRMFGWDPARLPPDYTEHQQLFTAESWQRLSTALESTQTTGVPYSLELEMIRADGSRGWMHARGETLRDAAGTITGLRGTAQDITTRKEAEKKLQLFRTLIECSTDAIEVLDPATGRFLDVNETACRTLGYTREEMLALTVFDIDPQVQRATFASYGERLKNTGSYTLEGLHRRKDGSTFPVEVSLSQVTLDREYGVTVVRDITARKQAEEALRASEAQLASAVKIARLGPWEYDVASDQFTFNDQFYAMLRTTAEREGGYVMSSAHYAKRFVHPDDLAVVATEIRRTQESADPQYSRQLEHRMIYADGEIGHLAVRFFAVRDQQGRVVKTYGVNQDITERVKAEETLRREQALFHSLVGAIPDNLYFKDRQSRFVQINDYMARRCGLGNSSAAVGKTDFDFFTEEHARQAYADEQRIMATGEPMIGVEEKETWPDGRVTWVSSTKVPLRDAEGRITGLVGISRDITDRKNLEAQFIQSQKLEAFGQLAGGVAHDFNNILGVILMQLNLLQMEPGLSGTLVSGLAELERHAMRGAGLTRQLLMFSRRREMETRMLDLNVVLEDLSKMLRRLLGEDIAFVLNKAPAPLWIEGDAGMVEQVAMNLCINARDAMRDGGQLTVALRSEVRAAPASAGGLVGEFCCLAVTDVGCGMDDVTKARIFEPFFTTKPTGKGTGLGLATVYGIMQQHRGWVEVDSAPNRGSTFRVYFPSRGPQVSDADAAIVREVPGGHESILLVEDEPALRQSMTACLQHAGYRVMDAANGVEALGKWEEEHHEFDLLITDYVMPEGMSGMQLATQLSRAKGGLRVIIMSGYIPGARDTSAPWPEEIIRLMKPFETRKLLQTVRQCLDAK